jgi:hypothetical protein
MTCVERQDSTIVCFDSGREDPRLHRLVKEVVLAADRLKRRTV